MDVMKWLLAPYKGHFKQQGCIDRFEVWSLDCNTKVKQHWIESEILLLFFREFSAATNLDDEKNEMIQLLVYQGCKCRGAWAPGTRARSVPA